MIQFYSPDIELTGVLTEGESAHCSRVLRKVPGDEIRVTDGKGHIFKCIIKSSDPKKTTVEIIGKEETPSERPYSLTLAVAPTKNADRLEWLVEKAVEIGVDRIVLLRCERSERKVQKTERLMKVMISAMKQSLSTRLPDLVGLTDFKDFVRDVGGESQKFFGYCSPEVPRQDFVEEYCPGGDVIMMIGPEGDFTSSEVEMALEKGFKAVSLGKKRLRTETAGVFAVSAINVINQEAELKAIKG